MLQGNPNISYVEIVGLGYGFVHSVVDGIAVCDSELVAIELQDVPLLSLRGGIVDALVLLW